ncbi:hypothetical protein [Streptomyces sp. NPDC091259]|uniref:hypothetical protein n=1 Tax=Streptomyces sp. NPDC091259 TaxID=3365976 RepID=UPI00381F27CD
MWVLGADSSFGMVAAAARRGVPVVLAGAAGSPSRRPRRTRSARCGCCTCCANRAPWRPWSPRSRECCARAGSS